MSENILTFIEIFVIFAYIQINNEKCSWKHDADNNK